MNKMQAQRLRDAVTLAAKDDRIDHAGKWDQAQWLGIRGLSQAQLPEIEQDDDGAYLVPISCGTFGCIAGHVALAAGDRMVIDGLDLKWALEGDVITAGLVRTKEGSEHRVAVRAAMLLGLGDHEAEPLFNAYNDLDGVVRHANHLLTEHGHDPIEPDTLPGWEDRDVHDF